MATRSKSAPRFSPGGRSACLKHVIEQVLESDTSSPLYKSVLQHFGDDESKFNVIDYFLCEMAFFENLTYIETIVDNPGEPDPTKVISRREICHVPNYLKARCIFFKRFLEEKKVDGEDLMQESFFMDLTLDKFMEWKAAEMTMNTSSPRAAKSRDLVADFKKGIKRDPSMFPSLKHIDNWPTFKRETMAQAKAQDVVNVFNPKFRPKGSEERELFLLQLYYVYAIFCTNLKTDYGRKLVRDHESSQNAQAIWKELSNDAEKSTVAQLNATDLLQYIHTARVENWKGNTLSFILHYQEQIRLYDQLQPPTEQTSEHAKMIYLQNAVYAIEELRSVQTTGSQLALANGAVPTYKDYEALLKSAASIYDRAHAPSKRQPTRSAELTDIWDANVTDSFHEDGNGFWNFKRIVGHEGPFRASDPEHKGSKYNVLVEWENGEITPEPLNVFGKDEPVTCAVYAHEHGLLEEEGWRRFKGHLERAKRICGYMRKMEEVRTQMITMEPDYSGC